MIWEITELTYQNVIEPQTVAISTTGQNEMLVLILGSRDRRDGRYNSVTYNGQNFTEWGYAIKDDDPLFATIHGVYFNCSGMTPGTYNMVKEVTTGGPDDGVEMWFKIKGINNVNPIDQTASNSANSSTLSNTVIANQDKELIITSFYSRKDGANAVTPVTTGMTEIIYWTTSFNDQFGAYYKEVNVGSHNFVFSQGSDRWAQISMSLKLGNDLGAFLLNFV